MTHSPSMTDVTRIRDGHFLRQQADQCSLSSRIHVSLAPYSRDEFISARWKLHCTVSCHPWIRTDRSRYGAGCRATSFCKHVNRLRDTTVDTDVTITDGRSKNVLSYRNHVYCDGGEKFARQKKNTHTQLRWNKYILHGARLMVVIIAR